MADTEVLVEGLAFGEGPRWHDGSLWFSDMHDFRVKRFRPETGVLEEIVEVPGRPSGLGWDPGGRLLIVSMDDRRLLRFDGASLTEVVDLSGYTDRPINDMVVSDAGRAYIGGFGFDFHAGDEPRATVLLAVGPDGSVSVAAEDLLFPNGMVLTADGSTLIVAESMGARLTGFTVDAGAALAGRRLWADLAPHDAVPDGICGDADGCVWVASPPSQACIRVREGGQVLQRVATVGRLAIACALGGPERRTLYVLTSEGLDPLKCAERRSGRLEAVPVDVGGAGWP